MYLNFIFVPIDYFKTIGWRVFVFEWVLPMILSCMIYYSFYKGVSSYSFNDYINKIISLESILVGFSITSVTFLTTAGNRNIEDLKKKETKKVHYGKPLFLMDLIIINFSFSLFLEILILISNLIFPLLLLGKSISFQTEIVLFSINIFFVLQNLFLNLRNLVDLYLALMRKE